MTAPKPDYTHEEIAAFARRYGLERLTEAHIARMRELAPRVSDVGRDLPRPTAKSSPPAPTFDPLRKMPW
ncbi:MAG: hypothetical protein R3D44_16000 [Hyphomicrobiaceae bacterium]